MWRVKARGELGRDGERPMGMKRLQTLGVVLASTVAVALTACGDDDAEPVSARDAPTSTPVDADTSWGGAIVSMDGTTLELSVGSSPEGDGPCEQRFQHEVIETEDTVTVAFDLLEQVTTTIEPVPCVAMAQPQHFEIHLEAPLGDRPLYNGVEPEPQDVWWLADVVEATVLPDGVSADDLDKFPGGGPDSVGHWSQSAQVPSGPGWDLWIDQAPEGSFVPPSTEPGEVIATTEVHGVEATMYEYFNHTGHLVHWTEGGLDITVRAELHTANMSEPFSFANPDVAFIDDEIIAVADGISVPQRTASHRRPADALTAR
jgi:hypothetical protein